MTVPSPQRRLPRRQEATSTDSNTSISISAGLQPFWKDRATLRRRWYADVLRSAGRRALSLASTHVGLTACILAHLCNLDPANVSPLLVHGEIAGIVCVYPVRSLRLFIGEIEDKLTSTPVKLPKGDRKLGLTRAGKEVIDGEQCRRWLTSSVMLEVEHVVVVRLVAVRYVHGNIVETARLPPDVQEWFARLDGKRGRHSKQDDAAD